MKSIKKVYLMIRLSLTNRGKKKAEIVKQSNIFKCFGDNCYWFPRIVPTEAHLISIHSNVYIATDVYFCTHDVMDGMLNNITECRDRLLPGKKYSYECGEIEIFDNVFIGAKSIILPNTKIGPNAIVAAGSVVTKDVPSGSVVGGNPAKVIGTFDDYVSKRSERENLK